LKELRDRLQDALIDFLLGLIRGLELFLTHKQRVVATFNDVEKILRRHFAPDVVQ